MANQALVQPGDYVLDPFVGTGGILVVAAHFNALCFGNDIDARVIHGLGVGQINAKSPYYKANKAYVDAHRHKFMLNFEQYGLRRPELIRMDACENAYRPGSALFDAILCDPPYGVRATSRKTKGKAPHSEPEEKKLDEGDGKDGKD